MKHFYILLFILLLLSCSGERDIKLFSKADFTTSLDGKDISLYTLSAGDVTMQVTNFGGRVVSLWTPDRDGNYDDIVLGYENIDRYINNKGERFLGAVVGRYANRIAGGRFLLQGKEYHLSTYNNGQCLHGGDKGFDMVVWDVEKVTPSQLVLSYISKDMEEGFPGTLTTTMTYTLTDNNEFIVEYKATTDKLTIVNLSHHSFFNLKGEGNGVVTDHILKINSSKITPVNKVLIPSGELVSVDGSPFDFRQPTEIGERINEENEQLEYGLGYDHNWVLDRASEDGVEFAASIYEPHSGRYLEVWTDQVAMQFYSGNFFDGTVVGKYGKCQGYRASFALETQKYPDSPNHSNFPSTELSPGEIYQHKCVYLLSVK